MKSLSGFTLIEAIIYLAIFSILIGGGIASAFYLFEAAAYGGTYAHLSEESDFMLEKIGWALRRADAVTAPTPSLVADTLVIHEHDDTTLVFTHAGTDLTLRVDSAPPTPLNASDVHIEAIQFSHMAETPGDHLESLTAVITLSARSENGTVLVRIATSTVYLEH
jgi:hypothetical protein